MYSMKTFGTLLHAYLVENIPTTYLFFATSKLGTSKSANKN